MCQINESNIYYLRIVEVTPLCINGVWRKIWPECVQQTLDKFFVEKTTTTSSESD